MSREIRAIQVGCRSLDPEAMTPSMRRILKLVAEGYSNREIGEKTGYAHGTIQGQVVALLAVFRARNRTHLAALAVARGYVVIE